MTAIEGIRLATEAEIESIRATSDLDPANAPVVFAMGKDLAVLKRVYELDPVYFAPDSADQRKLRFVWGLENHLRLSGLSAYYFNVAASDAPWRKVIETYGGEPLSPTDEIRYKKCLNR